MVRVGKEKKKMLKMVKGCSGYLLSYMLIDPVKDPMIKRPAPRCIVAGEVAGSTLAGVPAEATWTSVVMRSASPPSRVLGFY